MLSAILLFVSTAGSPEIPQGCSDAMPEEKAAQCAAIMFAHADTQLNQTWRTTADIWRAKDAEMDGTSSSQNSDRRGYFEHLLAAQRAWIAYRDAHCMAKSYTAVALTYTSDANFGCKINASQRRNQELEAMQDFQPDDSEGEMTVDQSQAESRLSTAFDRAYARLSKEEHQHTRGHENWSGHVEALRNSQATWERFRDTHCRSVSLETENRSLRLILASRCRILMPIDRAKALDSVTISLDAYPV